MAPAPNVQDHVVDEVPGTRIESTSRDNVERHLFQSIEQMGPRGDVNDRNQRIAAIVIALILCTALYGVLYLAMHFQE